VETPEILVSARHTAGLSQEVLAHRAGTSRPTLSAYEHGRKSPTLSTVQRLLEETDHELKASPKVHVTEHPAPQGRMIFTLTPLPRLPLEQAFAKVRLPVQLNWSTPDRVFDLADRGDRARLYEIVLREGSPADLLEYLDGALLVDLWQELVLPRAVRAAWKPIIEFPPTKAA
jgi:transcriptional regulator with XRE-family HTH domain